MTVTNSCSTDSSAGCTNNNNYASVVHGQQLHPLTGVCFEEYIELCKHSRFPKMVRWYSVA